jgi:aspartyl-tRNA(Asn)/glutamyl-tRNA(Gln) amidotransferase subunit A
MPDILTIAEAARRIAAKQLSPVELTKLHLDRIRRLDPKLNAFLLVTEERALADAQAAEMRQMGSASRGKLDGIPIAHKDIYNTAGIRTTAHSKLLEHNVPTRDAHTVKKWADAGTVMLGKLATHEFAFGGPSFDLPWPPPRNPWNTDHFTAGSSSGTGAAVAAGLILGGTGSDTGGSIRGPAALCGVAGIKPTYGLSSRVGIVPLAFTLDHAGPLAWTAEDCALLLQGMAGHDPEDPASADRPVPDFTADLGKGAKGLRIGVVRHFFETDHRGTDATRAGIDAAMDFFRKEGAEVRDIVLSPAADYHAVGYLIMITEAFTLHAPWMRERFMDYGESFRDRVALAATVSGPDLMQTVRRRRVLCQEMATAMENLDIIVSAAQPGEAPRIADVTKWANMEKPSFTMPFNVTGFPAISVCTGFGEGGLPVSMQLVGKPFTEPTVFRAAHAYETAMAWRQRRPAMAV